eukprot:scaffold57437_cov33-Tisochrysis_lutea.AAC.4
MKGPNYESLMRDDFTLFDAYEYEPAPAKIPVCSRPTKTSGQLIDQRILASSAASVRGGCA